MNEPSPDYDIDEKFNRPEKPPKKAEVKNWPFPQFAQQDDNDVANNMHINPHVYDIASGASPDREYTR